MPDTTPLARLAPLGWDAAWSDAAQRWAGRGLRPARVSAVDRAGVGMLDGVGEVRATLGPDLLAAIARDATAGPCAGDWALLREWPDGRTTVEALLPRRTALVRAVASGESLGQVLAANMDAVLVVLSLAAEPDLGRLERLLTLAWESGARPVVVLSKADLVTDAALVAAEVAAVAPGADLLVVSAVSGDGMAELEQLAAPGTTLAFVGQSGVGKSTLINALLGAEVLPTADVGAAGKGRHVTVRRELLVTPGGALVLDTPGLRGVGLVDVAQGLDLAFPEIEDLAARCRFADCGHEVEPGCAVIAAVEDGRLEQRRLESWRKLGREVRWMATRNDARARAAERRKWRAISLAVRRDGVARP